MPSDNVTIKIKLEDDGSFKKISFNADEMRRIIEQVKNENDKLKNSLINNNQAVQSFRELGDAVRGLQSVMHGLTDTYAVQVQAEARLEQMMHNTMDASNEEVQSIKDLAAQLERMGVIGDEIILSGAQELATYMQKKESLEALIPVMTDMIAQQYEYNASTSSAVAVAQMMGKVFAGEVGSLKRLGYSFDEAQEQILKFGTEEQKVAVLTEVVGGIVDGANKKLASTTYGTIVQFNNQMGTMKEQLGAIMAPAMNAVDSIANLVIAIAGISKGITVIKAAHVALKGLGASAALAATKVAVLRVHSVMTTTAQNMLAAAGIRAAAGTTALRVAVTALYAAMSLGLTLAIQGVITLITRLVGKTREAAEGMDAMKEANEAYKSAASNAKAEIDTEIAALKNLIDSGKDTTEAIQHLNEKYSEAFGYHQTAADWYDTLTGKSQTYCRQLGYEAKAKKLSAEVGELIVQRDELKDQLPKGDWKWDEKAGKYRDMSLTFTIKYADKDTRKKLEQIADLEKQIEDKTKGMESAFGKAAEAGKELNPTPPSNTILSQKEFDLLKQHYDDLTKKQRAMIDKGYADLTDDEQRALKKRYDTLSKSEKRELDKQYNEAIKAAETAQRSKENALKELYQKDGDKDAYEIGMGKVAIEGLEQQLTFARKYGKDTTKIEQQIADANIALREKEFEIRSTQLADCLADEKLALSMSLSDQEITQKEHDKLVMEDEERNLEEQLELYREFGKDATDIMQQLFDKRRQMAEGNYNDEAAALQRNLDDTEISLKASLANQAITQDQYDRLMLAAKARFYDGMLNLTRAYGKDDRQAMKDALDAQLNLQSHDKQQEDQKKEKQANPVETFTKGWGGIKGIGSSIRDIKDALTETDNAWDALTQTIDGFISMFQSVQQVVEIINTITAATQAMQGVRDAATQKELGNATAEVAANTAKAGSGAASSVASIPYVGPVLAIAAMASVIAALASLPKFANGGLVYGPTVGLMGEYGGASSNPEVIAPLSRLRALLGIDGPSQPREVKFRIAGRELVGIANKQRNIYRRSG